MTCLSDVFQVLIDTYLNKKNTRKFPGAPKPRPLLFFPGLPAPSAVTCGDGPSLAGSPGKKPL